MHTFTKRQAYPARYSEQTTDPTFLALAERQISTYVDGHALRCTPALAVRKTSPGTHKDRYRDVTDTKQGLGMLRR